jgi:amino acid permease
MLRGLAGLPGLWAWLFGLLLLVCWLFCCWFFRLFSDSLASAKNLSRRDLGNYRLNKSTTFSRCGLPDAYHK